MKEIKTILMGYGNHAIVYPEVILTASPSMIMSDKTGSLFSEKIIFVLAFQEIRA